MKQLEINSETREREKLIIRISGKERSTGFLWLIAGFLGIAFGLFHIINHRLGWLDWPPYVFEWNIYGFLTLAAGIANLFVARSSLKRARKILEENSNIVEEYNRKLPFFLFVLLYNIFFGVAVVFRLLPAIMTLVNRNFVLKNRQKLTRHPDA